MEEGQGLTLERVLEIAENCEKVNSQMAAMSIGEQEGTEFVNYVKKENGDWRDHKKKHRTVQDKTCYRCAKSGHFGKDPNCPAKEKGCRKCGLKDHFEAQ